MRSRTTAVLTTAVVIAVAGCSGGTTAGQQASSPTTAASTPASPWPTEVEPLPTASATVINEDTGQTVEPQVEPSWDDSARTAVTVAATRVMEAFARPGSDVSAEKWHERLEPQMTQQGAQYYAYVDPANVPVTKVTGTARIADDSSAYVADIVVPTNAGDYVVTMVRNLDDEGSWAAERITPPKGGR